LHSKGDRAKSLELFQKSVENNINQHSEIVEQIASNAHLFFLPGVPEQTRANYFYLIDAAYTRKLNSFPDDARDRMNYGRFLYLAGQVERSIDEYKKSIALFPEKQLALFQLGAIYFENGLLDEAVNVYRQAYEAEESFIQARIFYGVALMYANDNQKAQEVLEAVPLDTLIANDFFKDVFVKRGDLQSLLRIYKQRYNKNPDDFQTNLTLSMYLVKTGNHAQAKEVLESFVTHNPKHEKDVRHIIDELTKGGDPFK
jgi:tetratricopeptide (TPR) repeat protein